MKAIKTLCVILVITFVFGVFPASAASAGSVTGDTDGDSRVTVTDALFVLRCSAGLVTPSKDVFALADVNSSGKIDAIDSVLVLQFAVHIIDKFPSASDSILSGYNFQIGSVYSYEYQNGSRPRYYEQFDSIDDEYGCTTTVAQLNTENFGTSVRNGLCKYDIIEIPLVSCRNYARSSLLYDMSGIGIEPSFYSSALTGSCTLGNSTFGVATDVMSANPMGILINKDMLERVAPVNGVNLEQQFSNHTWTFDKFDALLDEIQSNTNGGECYTSNTNIIGQAIVGNAGYEVNFNADRTGASSSIATPSGIDAMTWLKSHKTSGAWRYQADINALYEDFINKKIPMLVYYLWAADIVIDRANFNMTEMPFPIGPDQNDYVMCTFDGTVFAIPKNNGKDPAAAATYLNSLAGIDEKLKADRLDTLELIFPGETLPQDIYRFAINNTSSDFSSGAFSGAVGAPVDGSALNPSMIPSEVLPAAADTIQSEVDNYYRRFYEKK